MTKKTRKYVQRKILQNFIENYEQYVLTGNPDSKNYNTIFLAMQNNEDSFIELFSETLYVLACFCKDDFISSFFFDSADTLRKRKGLDERSMILIQEMLSLKNESIID